MHTKMLLIKAVTMLPITGCVTDAPTPWMRDPSPRYVTELALAGKDGHQLEQLDAFPVVKVVSSTGCSSAIPIRPDLLLLSRHGIVDDTLLEINGRSTRVELVAAGGTDAWRDDWAYLRIDPPVERSIAHVDPERAIEPGASIYVLGFWHGGRLVPPNAVREVRRVIVEGSVTQHPEHPKAPCQLAFICVDIPYRDALKGMSGGPVVIWDPELPGYVVVGLYRGAWQLVDEHDRYLVSVHLVLRVPPLPPA